MTDARQNIARRLVQQIVDAERPITARPEKIHTYKRGVATTGIRRAWEAESKLVRETDSGTRHWSTSQLEKLREGKFSEVKGTFHGHHTNSKAKTEES